MPLERQVSSLEPSRKLKKLGVKQESLFYWCRPEEAARVNENFVCWYSQSLSTPTGETKDWEQISAFTVSELCFLIARAKFEDVMKAYGYVFNVPDTEVITIRGLLGCMTDPDIAANMFIYLIENGLITV